MQDLLERVLAISRCFRAAGVPHSFGGAIALAYYATARGTRDIDINVYLTADDADRVLSLLETLGVPPASALERGLIVRDGQVRLLWQDVPLDLFFWNIDFHDSCYARRQQLPLEDEIIDVLGPEDLIVCKVAFARDKDARDVEAVLDAMGESLDIPYVLRWVEAIAGLEHPSALRLADALASRGLARAQGGGG